MPYKRLTAVFAAIASTCSVPQIAGATDSFLHGARSVAVGALHSCAILEDTTVGCWGDNTWGQLGNAEVAASSVPVPVHILTPPHDLLDGVVAIAAGSEFTCALQGYTAKAYCWGRNDSGQLGAGMKDFVAHPYAVPVPMRSADDSYNEGVRQIAAQASGNHVCVLVGDADSTIRCWGYNYAGQLGNGTKSDAASPIEVVAPKLGGGYRRLMGATNVAVGGSHSCAIVSDAHSYAVCWGKNNSGQLGTGTHTDSTAATPVMITPARGHPYPLVDIDQIVAGGWHSCGVLDTTLLGECWGDNTNGQLGNPSAGGSAASPYGIPLSFVQLSGGDQHTCGILSDGHVACWGLDNDYQLGDGFTATENSPIVLPMLGTSVSAGIAHTCAVMRDTTVRCWGKNDHGQLGDGSSGAVRLPVTVVRFNDRIFADDFELDFGGL